MKAVLEQTSRNAGHLPPTPKTAEEAGLSRSFLNDLALKHLYRFGELTGYKLAEMTCLPFALLDETLDQIIFTKYAEKRGGKGMGNSTDIFGLTERGRAYVHEILEIDTYTGPAPVPLDQYTQFVAQKTIRNIKVTETMLRDAWHDFILSDEMYSVIGPAMCSGKSCFLYGPPGTGKTTLAKAVARYYDLHGGHIAIPHAVFVGGSIIRVFDPVYHKKVETNPIQDNPQWLSPDHGDRRWVLCQRPTVTVGGELTLDMLDLRYNATTRYYEAPLQMKANGGVFVIDDFGRQLVSPKDLLNRWIVPLEENIDYLTLHTGKKFTVPFEELVAFATNLDPNDLADEAFLRRIRYKIYVGELPVPVYKQIFEKECTKKQLAYCETELDSFIEQYYIKEKHPVRACDPRDFTDGMQDYITYNDLPNRITSELLHQFTAANDSLKQV